MGAEGAFGNGFRLCICVGWKSATCCCRCRVYVLLPSCKVDQIAATGLPHLTSNTTRLHRWLEARKELPSQGNGHLQALLANVNSMLSLILAASVCLDGRLGLPYVSTQHARSNAINDNRPMIVLHSVTKEKTMKLNRDMM